MILKLKDGDVKMVISDVAPNHVERIKKLLTTVIMIMWYFIELLVTFGTNRRC